MESARRLAVDLATVVAQIPGLPQPVGVAVSARDVYVTHYLEAGVSVLDI